jgi:dienelactone hydrolase
VGENEAMSGLGVYDLVGNVREWLVNEMGDGQRATRGAAWDDPQWVAFHHLPKPAIDRSPTHGIRLVRYLDPGPELAYLERPVEPRDERDYRNERPAPASEFEIYRRLYDYDATPVEAIVEREDTTEHWIMQTVGFDPPYAGPRAGAYVFLPRTRGSDLQPVIFWPGSGALNVIRWEEDYAWTWDFLVRSGRAVVMPIFLGTYERDDPENNITHGDLLSRPGSNQYREYSIAWVKDLKRTIDYLETRDDMDTDRISFYGRSWGGQAAPLALAVEPRIKVAVLFVAGLWTPFRWLPEIDPLHFLPHVTQPVLMMNGEFDVVFPLETAQKPFYDYLGTDPEHKRHLVYPLGHGIPQDEAITETLDWLDTYLGPPGG